MQIFRTVKKDSKGNLLLTDGEMLGIAIEKYARLQQSMIDMHENNLNNDKSYCKIADKFEEMEIQLKNIDDANQILVDSCTAFEIENKELKETISKNDANYLALYNENEDLISKNVELIIKLNTHLSANEQLVKITIELRKEIKFLNQAYTTLTREFNQTKS